MNLNYRLWTPIANALEAYRRRLLNEPNAVYEHIWRLIHIHEAIVVTLGSILASKLLAEWSPDIANISRLNQLRSLISGLSEDNSKFPSTDSCFGGSIKSWITLLQIFGRKESATGCIFCESLASYLEEVPQKKLHLAFLEAWKKVSPVTSSYSSDVLPRIKRFDAINSLRNKLAHVPLPERILNDLHKGLRYEIWSSLSPEYSLEIHEKGEEFTTTKWHQPLYGIVFTDKYYVTGSDYGKTPHPLDTEIERLCISPKPIDNNSSTFWPGFPFFNLDKECKVSLLFRIPVQDVNALTSKYLVAAEYHRFAAEIEPVRKSEIIGSEILPWIPDKEKEAEQKKSSEDTEYSTTCEAKIVSEKDSESVQVPETEKIEITGNEDHEELRTIAESSFVKHEYELAIQAFDALSKTNDRRFYNDVAKSKHGTALWKYVSFNEKIGDEEKIEKIKAAIEILKQAAKHVDPIYQAKSLYSMSKANFQLWKLSQDKNCLDTAYKDAKKAAGLGFDPMYITWVNRLEEEL